jgi:uncharacterized membrane protein YbaN (DUF454 family)
MKYLFLFSGILSLILGIIGIFLPVLPTTPFLLLSAFLFARSSKRLYDWLLNHKVLGEYIKGFLQEKAIPLHIKIYSISVLWLTIICSIVFAMSGKLYLQILLAAIAIGVTIHILSYKTKKKHPKDENE